MPLFLEMTFCDLICSSPREFFLWHESLSMSDMIVIGSPTHWRYSAVTQKRRKLPGKLFWRALMLSFELSFKEGDKFHVGALWIVVVSLATIVSESLTHGIGMNMSESTRGGMGHWHLRLRWNWIVALRGYNVILHVNQWACSDSTTVRSSK